MAWISPHFRMILDGLQSEMREATACKSSIHKKGKDIKAKLLRVDRCRMLVVTLLDMRNVCDVVHESHCRKVAFEGVRPASLSKVRWPGNGLARKRSSSTASSIVFSPLSTEVKMARDTMVGGGGGVVSSSLKRKQ
jgi:hypothetical protein